MSDAKYVMVCRSAREPLGKNCVPGLYRCAACDEPLQITRANVSRAKTATLLCNRCGRELTARMSDEQFEMEFSPEAKDYISDPAKRKLPEQLEWLDQLRKRGKL